MFYYEKLLVICLAMSNNARKAVFWGSDQVQHNWFIQSQKKTRSLKFRIYEAVGLHYLCRESKDTISCLRLCFCIGKNPVFSGKVKWNALIMFVSIGALYLQSTAMVISGWSVILATPFLTKTPGGSCPVLSAYFFSN